MVQQVLRKVAVSVMLVCSSVGLAHAAEEAASTSTATSAATGRSIMDQLYLSYFATFHGPNLDNPGSSRTVKNDGTLDPKSSVNFDGDITAAYLVAPSIGVGPYIPFLASPVRGNGLTLGDVGIKLFDKKTVNSNGFTLATNIILQAPTSDYSQDRKMQYGIKTTPSIRYVFPNSRFSTGAFTEAKAYVGAKKGKDFKLWAGPWVNYKVSPNFSLNMLYEMEADHFPGKPDFDFTSVLTDLQPGVVWNITPKVLVNPFLQIYTGEKITVGRTAIGAVVSATL